MLAPCCHVVSLGWFEELGSPAALPVTAFMCVHGAAGNESLGG